MQLDDQDKQLITEFGLEKFGEPIQLELLSQYYETLDLRLSMALEDKLTDEQLEEFDKLYDAGDDGATKAWLHTAIEDYDAVVDAETAAVKADIKGTMDTMRRAIDEQQ